MSDFEKSNHDTRLERAKAEIFQMLARKALAGAYFEQKYDQPAEYVNAVPELGEFAVCSTDADNVHQPEEAGEIRVAWSRPERKRAANFWLTPNVVEAQYVDWNADGGPVTMTERQPIHPEALVELHQALIQE